MGRKEVEETRNSDCGPQGVRVKKTKQKQDGVKGVGGGRLHGK